MPCSVVQNWAPDNHRPYQTFTGEAEWGNVLCEDQSKGLQALCDSFQHGTSSLDPQWSHV